MKKISYFKQVLLQVTFVTSILLIASCSTQHKAKDTAAASREQNDAKYDNNQTDRNNQTNQTDRNNQANRNNQADSINQTNKNNHADNTYQTERNNQNDKNNYAGKNNQTDSINHTDKNNHTDNTYQNDKNNHSDNSNRTDSNNQIDQDNQKEDAQFLVNAVEMSLEEIQLGQLAQQNGETSHVKELGKMMEDAHTKSLKDLTALAKRKMIYIPTSTTDDAKDAYKKLNEKSGNDFDKAYTDRMVSGHKKAITTFEKASADINDTDIKDWATASLTDLRTHLDHSIDSQKRFNDMYLEKKN